MSDRNPAPVVSVIVPVRNRRHCVMDGIGSVLAQTWPHVECIVVDDGSEDGTVDAVTAATAGDWRVRVFAQTHRGVSAARNRGLREAGGDYVTFLDSDDLMPPARIGRQLELLAAHPADAVLGKGESVVMPGVAPPVWVTTRPGWASGPCWMTLLAPTARIRAVGGFDEGLRSGEDADLMVKLRHAGVSLLAVDDTFVIRRIFGDNLTYFFDERTSTLREAIRRHLPSRRQ